MTDPKTGVDAVDIPTEEDFKADFKPRVQAALVRLGTFYNIQPHEMERMLAVFWQAYNAVTDEELEMMYNITFGDGSLAPLPKIEIARVH